MKVSEEYYPETDVLDRDMWKKALHGGLVSFKQKYDVKRPTLTVILGKDMTKEN